MRQSQLFTKTSKEAPKDEVSLNSQLLIRAGFVDKLMAGVYTMLPLGWKTLTKIEQIIREEMNAFGAQEMFMFGLSPQSNWKQTERIEKIDVLFSAQGANENSKKANSNTYILNSTHEEIITPLVKKFANSYKDLPFSIYQIQTKFRNEPRPKSGLLRGREFRMKDLYSFHKSEKGLRNYYEKAKEVYIRIFERLGVGKDTYITLASGGDFTKDYSHEFQTKCPTGEDTIFKTPISGIYYNREVAPSKTLEIEQEEEKKPLEEILTKDVVTVERLVKFLQVPIEKTVKTLFYKDEKEKKYAVAVRGDYEINEEKLQKVINCQSVSLISEEEIEKITGAKMGYAGLINLSDSFKVVIDDSLEKMVNFEIGINKTDYHATNVNWDRDIKKPSKFYDIKIAKEGDLDPESEKPFETFKASEVGNIFPLNVKFSKSFNYYYTDKKGEEQIVYMGSYGIGTTRIMGVLAEKFSDAKGLKWPEAVAPFKLHLISLGQNKKTEEIYQKLTKNGVEVLYDDREEISAGEKFAEADLIGCPIRLVVSKKTLEKDSVEYKERGDDKAGLVKIDKITEKI